MVGEWYYRILDQEFGPVSLEIIQALVEEGQLCAQNMVKQTASQAWQRADTCPELFPEVSLFTLRSDVREGEPGAAVPGEPSWYCLVGGQVHGPVGFDVLRQWVSDRRLLPNHLVREGTSELWTEAGSLERLFRGPMEPAPPLRDPSPDEICDILLGVSPSPANRRFSRATGADDSLPMPAEVIGKTAEPASTVPTDETFRGESGRPANSSAFARPNGRDAANTADGDGKHLSKQPAVRRKRFLRRRFLPAVVLCLIAVVITVLLFRKPDRPRYQLMMTVWDQTQHLKQQNASRSQWRAFIEQTHRQLDPVLGELKHSHSSAGQHLLVAGQELLQTIQLEGNGGQSSDVAEDFQWQMDRVAELLAGRPELDEEAVPTARRPDEKLEATTRLYLPLMLHGKTFVSGNDVWNANVDDITDIAIDRIVPVGEGWFEAVATVTASDSETGHDLRAKVKVRYRVPPGSLGTAPGMQRIPYGRVTVLSIKPLER